MGRSHGYPELLAARATSPDAPVVAASIGAVTFVASVLAMYVWFGQLPALAASGVFALAVGAIAVPRAFRVASYIWLVLVPFVMVWPALRPDEYNYLAYFAAFALALVALGAFQPRMFAPGLGTIALAYVAVAAAVVIVPLEGVRGVNTIAVLVAAFAMYTLVRRADARERWLLVILILALGVAQSALGIAQAVAGWPVFTMVMTYLQQSERNYFAIFVPGVSSLATQGSGTFVHFNYLGALLAACLPLALGVWLENKRAKWRLVVVALTAAGLVATFSRGALLGAIAGTLLILWFGPRRSRRANVGLLVSACLLVGLFSVNVFTRYYESTQNVTIRAETWQTAVSEAMDQPSSLALGYGYGHFQREVLASGRGGQSSTQASGYMSTMHSSLLQLTLELGVVGLVLCAAWLFTVFGRLTPSQSTLVAPALGGATGVLISQTLDNALFSIVGVVFVALVAVAEGSADSAASD